jgi:hypothetical protein
MLIRQRKFLSVAGADRHRIALFRDFQVVIQAALAGPDATEK